MSVYLEGQERIAADRMWRDVDQRKAFERATGLTDEHSGEYHDEFREWAAAQLRCPYARVSGPGGKCTYPKCGLGCLGRTAGPASS